ncbi:MAG: ribonuclease, partial [Acidobacteriota bacterium]|nr:ribonuclease [Acidobacteriota bacterium]
MTTKMLVESDPHETRIAVLEDDRLTEIFVERHRHRGLVGNVYKGRVTRVLPGMQAAFVDIGLDRDAFLYVSDVTTDVEAMEEEDQVPEIDEPRSTEEPNHGPPPSIGDLLKQGQEIIVQVVKDPLPNKGARISTHVTLPGRYLVLLPTVRHFGVSRRIEEEAERERLLGLLGQLPVHGGGGGGLIVRTVGEG